MSNGYIGSNYVGQNKLRNPYVILRELTTHQWLMFAAGFLGWTWDAFDFFTVSMTITEISADFGVSYSDVSWVSTWNGKVPCTVLISFSTRA